MAGSFPWANALPAAAYAYPPVPALPSVGIGSEVQAQSNALLVESMQIMEKMRLAAERGADTVARVGQLAQELAQAGRLGRPFAMLWQMVG